MKMPETERTNGLSQRELLLEVREDVKQLREHVEKELKEHTADYNEHLLKPHTGAVGRAELYTVMMVFAGLLCAAAKLLLG
jgi:hypothetical protein